jgi:V/A-type H+/Na+-transporting ATPase subunit C
MSDYDYLNARVRGMSTTLLTHDFYDQILGSTAENLFVDALLGSPYGPELHAALATRRGAAAVEAALRTNAHASFAKLLSLAPPEPRRLLSIQLNRWDLSNILALIRGKLSGAEPMDIVEAVLPVGEFTESQLGELAGEPDLQALADSLTTWNYAFAFVLRRALKEYGEPRDLPALEHALNRTYFLWALAQLREDEPNQRLVRDMIRRQIDILNVTAALDHVRDRTRGVDNGREDPIPRGKLPPKTLAQISQADSLDGAFENLEETYLAPGIEKGILTFGQTRILAVMERFLEAVVIERGCRLFRTDMLSVAVPLGFLWRKHSEIVNLRILNRGKAYRMPANAIREELVLV